jgi:O-antigen ligase
MVIALTPFLVDRGLVARVPEWFGRLQPWIVFVTPTWVVIGAWANQAGHLPEGLGIPKSGDAAVHLGGAAAFLLAGLSALRPRSAARPRGGIMEWAVWPALLLGIAVVGSWTRGGLLAALVAIMVVLAMVPLRAGGKMLMAMVTAVFIGSAWLGSGISIVIREDRVIDPQQIVKNLGSVGGSTGSDLDNTREWRLEWWQDIIDYTVFGPHFWTGKGYGINLTYDDGIEPDPNVPSRSPHNGTLTVLARSGVPGLILWVALQLSFAYAMMGGFLRARWAGQQVRASVIAWVVAYWCAFMVNASFDVYLEGPQGGIWFWCLMAYGLALLLEERDPSAPRPQGRVPATARSHRYTAA